MNEEITPERLTKQIILFRDFLVKSWSTLDELMENHDWDNDMGFPDDWIQVNWEFLIERELLGINKYFTPLSTPLESRVLLSDDKFDFSVVYFSEEEFFTKEGKIIPKGTRMRLIGFSTKNELNGFSIRPPFDYVDFVIDWKRKEIIALPIKDIKFHIEPFNPSYFS